MTPGLSWEQTRFVPGTNPVKIWDKPRFSPYFTKWKPGKPKFVPGTSPGLSLGQARACPWDKPGAEGRHKKFFFVKKVYVPFSLAIHFKPEPSPKRLF